MVQSKMMSLGLYSIPQVALLRLPQSYSGRYSWCQILNVLVVIVGHVVQPLQNERLPLMSFNVFTTSVFSKKAKGNLEGTSSNVHALECNTLKVHYSDQYSMLKMGRTSDWSDSTLLFRQWTAGLLQLVVDPKTYICCCTTLSDLLQESFALYRGLRQAQPAGMGIMYQSLEPFIYLRFLFTNRSCVLLCFKGFPDAVGRWQSENH